MKLKQFFAGLLGRSHASARFAQGLTAVFIGLLVVFNTAIYGLANRYSWYFYTTPHLEHTVGDATDQYLKEVAGAGQVNILFCDFEEELEGDRVYNLVWQTANQLAEKHDFITVETVNIRVDPDRVEKYKYETDPETGDYVLDENGQRKQVNTLSTDSVVIDGAESFVVLHMSSFFILDDQSMITAYNGEEIFASMIHRVQEDELPTAYFTISHGESFSTSFYNRLMCAGYMPTTVDLMAEELEGGEGDLLVIANPAYDFIRGNPDKGIVAELDKIEAFLERGGSVWVMLDPLITTTVYLEEFLASWGISVDRATVTVELANGQKEQVTEAVMVRDPANSVTTDGYALVTSPAGSAVAEKIADAMKEIDAGRVIVSRASSMTLTGVGGKTVSGILTTSSAASAFAAGEEIDKKGSYTVAAMSVDNESGGGIFAVSSVYLTAQDAMTTNEYGNRDMIFLVLKELTGIKVPAGCSLLLIDPTGLEDLTMREARLWTALLAVVLPLGVGVSGYLILKKRRNR